MEDVRLREFAVIIAMMGMGVLIMLGSDRQSVQMLEGKLYKRGRMTGEAKFAYRKHLNNASVTQVVVGMGLIGLGIILWVNKTESLAILCGTVAVTLCLLGIRGRVRSFTAADADLDR